MSDAYLPAGGARAGQPASLADVLDRVLDKGLVIAGDIGVSLLDVEVLTIKVRLLLVSAEKAEELGIDWWRGDPALSSVARGREEENRQLRARLEDLEAEVATRNGNGRESERGEEAGQGEPG